MKKSAASRSDGPRAKKYAGDGMTSSIAFRELCKSFARSGNKFEMNQRRTLFYIEIPDGRRETPFMALTPQTAHRTRVGFRPA
jgi:hypothetical protein